jgi:methionyl-tRNA formyltransferase
MGTPDFAVPSLKALHQNGFDIPLVITQPDRPKGRGRQMVAPPVKTAAASLGLDIFQPESIRTEGARKVIEQIQPDIIVVAAFGKILPRCILDIPDRGAVNVHASLLPRYRGAAPIQWAIINMEKETGITLMNMGEGLDTGDILSVETTPITFEDTADVLHDRLAEIGASLLVRTLKGLSRNKITPVPQDHSEATYAPMLRKKDGRIDWTWPAKRIEAFIRGMTPWPGAFTFLGDKRFKVFRSQVLETEHNSRPGTVVRGFPDELRIATGKGLLSILEIQGASGKRMPIKVFLQGYKIPVETLFC